MIRLAGQGNYSKIFLCEHKKTGQQCAIKEYHKQRVKQVNKMADLNMEKHVLKILKGCPYVAQGFDTFQDEYSYYVRSEFVPGGELWELVKVYGLGS